MKQAGSTTYLVNGLGQRVKKSTAGADTYFAYDEAGHLIGEYDTSGAAIEETVWLGDMPVAVLKPAASGGGADIFYIWADHLGTPRLITDAANNSRWEWPGSDPFGNNAPNENPAGLGIFTYNLRFPGQYFDAETGKHYNYFRDYDPGIGRYVESDPIGLKGGLNTFAYVATNPLLRTDPLGLDGSCPACTPEKLAWIAKCLENAQDSAKWRYAGCSYLPLPLQEACRVASLAYFYIRRAWCTSRYPECRGEYTVGSGPGGGQ